LSVKFVIPRVGQVPKRRKVCAETEPRRTAAAAIEQKHFMLDAIERQEIYTRKALKVAMQQKTLGKLCS
jgi:hypothetical protein